MSMTFVGERFEIGRSFGLPRGRLSSVAMSVFFKRGLLFFSAICTIASLAMPTKKELKAIEPVVLELMSPELQALKTGSKKLSEVASAAQSLAFHAEGEAARLLLLRGAVDLYSRAGEVQQVVNLLGEIKYSITEVPDEELLRVAEDALRALPNKGNADLSSVRTIVSELKIRIQASSWLTKFKKQLRRSPNDAELHRTAAEAHVVLDDWPSALKEFAKAGPDWAKGVEGDSAESATPELIADFWWRMADSTKNRALEAAYRRRAATYYQKALDKNLLNGLLKMRAERRVAEVSSLVDFCALLREKVVKPLDVKSYVFNLTGTGPCLETMERIQESGAEKFKTDKLLLNRIPDGIFQMGLVAEDSHSVKISRPFWAGVYLVTHAQWGHVMPPRKLSPEQVALGGEKAAVVSITRQEVEEFCQKLTEKAKDLLPTGYVFRLPTIAEDEYILQAGNTDMSVFDFRAPSTSTFRLRFGVCEEGKKQILAKHGIVKDEKFWKIPANHITVEVGLREPNDWGIYDCWGNGDVFLMDVFPKDTTTFIKEMKKLPWKDEADPFFWSADGIDGCSVFHVDTRSASGSRLFWMCLKPRGNFKCLGFRLVLAPDLVAERNALKKN